MTPDERARLHAELDHLLDTREALEKPTPTNALASFLVGEGSTEGSSFVDPTDQFRAWVVFKNMMAFSSQMVGDAIREIVIPRSYETSIEAREVLGNWMRLVRPILQLQPRSWLSRAAGRELTTFGVEHALKALTAGEVQPIFEPIKGRNRRANRYSLAQSKLEALAWEKRLRALGYHTKEAKNLVTGAFGEQWDTIRKWRKQCEEILGQEAVQFSLQFAGSEHDSQIKKPRSMMNALAAFEPLNNLNWAGSEYKRQRSLSAQLSKRKGRTLEQ